MSFASFARMSNRARMVAGLRGLAIPTRAAQFSDARTGATLGMHALAGLGLTNTVEEEVSPFGPEIPAPRIPTQPAVTLVVPTSVSRFRAAPVVEASPAVEKEINRYAEGREESYEDAAGQEEAEVDDSFFQAESEPLKKPTALQLTKLRQADKGVIQTLDTAPSGGVSKWVWIGAAAIITVVALSGGGKS